MGAGWWRLMWASSTPASASTSKMCWIMGLPATGAMGLGITPVNGKSRVPLPAARTIAFMKNLPFRREGVLTPVYRTLPLRIVGIRQGCVVRPHRSGCSSSNGPAFICRRFAGDRICLEQLSGGRAASTGYVASPLPGEPAQEALGSYPQEPLYVLYGRRGYIHPAV